MADRDGPRDADVLPLAELEDLADVPRVRTARSAGRWRRASLVAFACVVIATIPVARHVLTARGNEVRPVARLSSRGAAATHANSGDARAAVMAAFDATIATRNFHFSSQTGETGTAWAASRGIAIAAHGTINLDPLAIVSTANVGSLGEITTWVNATTVWEQGGGQYGLSAGPNNSPGAPLSGFAPLVGGTLGPREGGVAMMSLASPTGYLALSHEAMTSASRRGAATVDGVIVTEYALTIDASRLVNRPGMSDEQLQTASAAFTVLKQQGYTQTDVVLAVDANMLIRRSTTVIRFADGGSINATTTFSDFGCAGTVALPGESARDAAPSQCVPADTVAPSTTAPAATEPPSTASTSTPPSTIHISGTNVRVAGSFKGTEYWVLTKGRCPDLDHRLDSAFTRTDGTVWQFHADYCGTLDGDHWSGEGTFTFTASDGAILTGVFQSAAKLPSPGVPYTLNITAGTGTFDGATGECRLDNHLRVVQFGVQEQYGTFTCDIRT